MSNMITVRDLKPFAKSWLKAEARSQGISMEEFVRRLILKECKSAKKTEKPSEIVRRHFGPENGLDLPPRINHPARIIDFSE